MLTIRPTKRQIWLFAVNHARVASCLAAMCASFVVAVGLLMNGTDPAITLLRAATVFVLTYAVCLGFLVLLQRALARALAMEYLLEKAARKAAAAAAKEAAQEEARGDDASESLTAQEA